MDLQGLCLQLLCLAILSLSYAHASDSEPAQNATSNRSGKLFSVFQVVRFQNTACTGSGSKNGTCYTSSECLSKGGTSSGSCASGYGVCCVLYMDASDSCNTLGFELSSTAGTYAASPISNRQWSIKVTQYSCDYNNLAPEGCTQYYFGATTQCVYSYNYAGGAQLANQNQNICVRICWTAVIATDFAVSGAAAGGIVAPSQCCAHGAITPQVGSFDCVSIPGAEKATGVGLANMRFCGRSGGLTTIAGGTTGKSICSDNQPFQLRYLTDAFELAAEAIAAPISTPKGFKLCYIEDTTSC